ncbi:MAG: hypothetical protein A2041_00795 [Bacteroidetes bacterium GWA2_31_9b]|nr:MAG: hypothetical protein A2041_00795 [Bacteroidetes bacterium GWA2_31_9b]
MKKIAIRFFVLAIVFLAVTVVFYDNTEISFAKYLIFVMGGIAAGSLFTRGIIALKTKEEE